MKPENLQNSSLLLRKTLGSIDFADIEKLRQQTLSDEEYQARASVAESFWNNYFKDILKLKIQEQLEFTAKEALDDQTIFGRGTLNGLILIQEWFEGQISISRGKQSEEKPQPGEIL